MGHGGMNCAMKTIRFVMVVINTIFLLIGLALIGLGIYLMVDPSLQKIKEFLPIDSNPGIERGLSYLEVAAIVIIVLGGILTLFGFFGCCGAMKQVKFLLIIYICVVGAIVAVEIAMTIYFVAFRSKFEEQILPKLVDTVKNEYQGPLGLTSEYNQTKPSTISLAWDFVMYNLQCCGVRNQSEFRAATKWDRTNPWWNSSMDASKKNFTVPLTCCPLPGGLNKNWNELPSDKWVLVADCAVSGNQSYQTGCYTKITELIDNSKVWIIVGAVLILVIEILALLFAVLLCCRKKKDQTYYSS